MVFAHAGHVLIDLPIYLGPVIVIIAWLKLSSWREKRAAARDGSAARGASGRRPGRDER